MIPFTIRTRGDNGRGCYAGVEISILVHNIPVAVVPLFWKTFGFQAEAEAHDVACDAITYWATEPERAWRDYDYATRKLVIDCRRRLSPMSIPDDHEEISRLYTQIDRAEWLCNLWGEVRYGLSVAGYKF